MTNAFFTNTGGWFGDGSIDWDTDTTIKVYLIRGYTYSASHQFLSDITGAGGTVVGSDTFLSKTVSASVFDAADSSYGSIASGAACSCEIMAKDTGVAGSTKLIGFIDTATGLPVTPNGSTIGALWDAAGIFKIGP